MCRRWASIVIWILFVCPDSFLRKSVLGSSSLSFLRNQLSLLRNQLSLLIPFLRLYHRSICIHRGKWSIWRVIRLHNRWLIDLVVGLIVRLESWCSFCWIARHTLMILTMMRGPPLSCSLMFWFRLFLLLICKLTLFRFRVTLLRVRCNEICDLPLDHLF